MSAPLLPCPFCGGTDIYVEPDEYGSGGQWVAPVHVGCKSCRFDLASHDDTDEAVAAWNKRAPSHECAALLVEVARWRFVRTTGRLPTICTQGYYYEDGVLFPTPDAAIDAARQGA